MAWTNRPSTQITAILNGTPLRGNSNGDYDHAEHHDDLATAVNSVVGILGTDPSGQASTVTQRFDLLDAVLNGEVITPSRLGSGLSGDSTDSSLFLRGDGVWATPASLALGVQVRNPGEDPLPNSPIGTIILRRTP